MCWQQQTAPAGSRSAEQAHKIICRFWKAASSPVSSPHSPFVSARKCLEWGMKTLACPCSSKRVFLQLQRSLASSEQGAQVRFPPQITEKRRNTHITFHSESFCIMRVTRRSLLNKRALQFSISSTINKSHTYTSPKAFGKKQRKAGSYRHIYQKIIRRVLSSRVKHDYCLWYTVLGKRHQIPARNLTLRMYEDSWGNKK